MHHRYIRQLKLIFLQSGVYPPAEDNHLREQIYRFFHRNRHQALTVSLKKKDNYLL